MHRTYLQLSNAAAPCSNQKSITPADSEKPLWQDADVQRTLVFFSLFFFDLIVMPCATSPRLTVDSKEMLTRTSYEMETSE